MEPTVDPVSWDVIVVGSGLGECLIARWSGSPSLDVDLFSLNIALWRSALAKAGKSVLLMDQEDTYGSEYASLSLAALMQAARGVEKPSLTAEATCPMPGIVCDDGAVGHALHEAVGSHAGASLASLPTAERSMHIGGINEKNKIRVPIPPFRPPLWGVQGFVAPGEDGDSGTDSGRRAKAFILDLMPKVLQHND